MDREEAHAFARERCLKETTFRHLVSVEGVMRALARRFDEDQDLWGLTGLFHDLDQDHTGDAGAQHARLAASWLRAAGVDERVVNGVLAHAYEEFRTDRMSTAVVHADAVAGLLVAAALVGFASLLAGELCERHLFFTASVAPRMPGGIV